MRHLHSFIDHQDKVRLLPGEKTLDLQIFSDATFLEASRLEWKPGRFRLDERGKRKPRVFSTENGPVGTEAVHGRNGWNLVDG